MTQLLLFANVKLADRPHFRCRIRFCVTTEWQKRNVCQSGLQSPSAKRQLARIVTVVSVRSETSIDQGAWHHRSRKSVTTMPRQKGRGSGTSGSGKGNGAHRGRSNLREAWAGGNYNRSSVSPDGSDEGAGETAIPFRLAMWDLGQCDKKRCTGTKLVRQHVVSELRLGVPFPGVILSPNGKCCVSNDDKELIGAKGLAVVDCSWNKLDEVPFGEWSKAECRGRPWWP